MRVQDKTRFVSQAAIPNELKQIVNQFENRASELWEMKQLQEAARVFPNVLRAIARQLLILSESTSLPIEVLAGACRTVFEINVRVRLFEKDSTLIKAFLVERVFEEISLLESFKRLSDSKTSPLVLRPIDVRIEELRKYIQKWQLKKPDSSSIFKQAESAGLAEEYKALYGFYSKYAHGSAWLVNAKDGERDGEGYRNIFLIQSQFYAFDALGRIEDYVKRS